MSIEPKKLLQACFTQWNSSLYMIQSLLVSFTAVLADERVTNHQYQYLELSPAHWVVLEDLSKALEHLEVATMLLSEKK